MHYAVQTLPVASLNVVLLELQEHVPLIISALPASVRFGQRLLQVILTSIQLLRDASLRRPICQLPQLTLLQGGTSEEVVWLFKIANLLSNILWGQKSESVGSVRYLVGRLFWFEI